MTKHEILLEIYRMENQTRALEDKPEVDLASPRIKSRIENEACDAKKYRLEERLASARKHYDLTLVRLEHEARLAEYFSTPEGAAFKADTETAILNRIDAWEAYEKSTARTIEQIIRTALGEHWGVVRFNKGFAAIGVIDPEKSTPERREYYFGQEIEIRYEQRNWRDCREIFEANCGSCGSFDMEGGDTVGQRAMFYAGIGRLFGDPARVALLKDLLRTSAKEIERHSHALSALRGRLADPFMAASAE